MFERKVLRYYREMEIHLLPMSPQPLRWLQGIAIYHLLVMHMEKEITFAFKLYNIGATHKYINPTNNRLPM
jgi:hypothetical protein